jgi:transcription initiation factor TFIID subunit 8
VLDFEAMLEQHDISLSALEDEMLRMPSKPPAAMPTDTAALPPEPDLSALLGLELDGSLDTRCRLYDHLPPFPSRHTYQQTPVFSERPTDPRMIREKATAEARLAEAALRKLLAVSAGPPRKETAAQVGRKRKQRHEEWKKAFEGLSGGDGFARGSNNNNNGVESLSSIMNDPIPNASASSSNKTKENDVYLEVVVNADSQFWRKGAGNAKRAQTAG